jgi:tripartite-type tricarboxylate transporter receptor subunit TctC
LQLKAKGEQGKAKGGRFFPVILPRSTFILCCAVAPCAAMAQQYPDKPIRFIIPYTPGGNTDTAARLVAPHVSENLGQPVVIDNRGGAGGIVATETAAHAAPDGYTLLFATSGGLSIQPLLQRNLPYDVERDFAPVSLVLINPQLLVASPALGAKTMAEFLKLARAKPGSINYASVGAGSPSHLAMELLKSLAHIDLVHVPYKGSAPATLDLIAGSVSVLFSSVPVMMQHVKAGRLRVLAVGSATRTPAAPDVPTVAESGVPGFEYTVWYGLVAPAHTPRAVLARLNEATVKALRAPQLDQQLRAQGSDPRPSTMDEMAKFLKTELARWSRVVKTTGLAGKVNP